MSESRSFIESTLALWVARLIAPTLVMCVLSVSSWIGLRAIATLDQHGDKLIMIDNRLEKALTTIEFMTKQRDAQFAEVHKQLDDHEGRLRDLEVSASKRGPR